MSVCGVRCHGLRLERRRLHAATPCAAPPAPRAPLRCRAAAGAQSEPSALLNRRQALAAGAAATLLRAGRAGAEDDEAWTRYTRAFRERFETSISSATRAYTFEYPASWAPGAPRGGSRDAHALTRVPITRRGGVAQRRQAVRR